jgi:predicted metalloprotease
MPSRLSRALAALALTMIVTAGAAAAPTPSAAPAAPQRFQDDPLAEDELSSFTMPGLTPDNLTASVLGDIDAFWAGELANLGYDYYAAGMVPVSDIVTSSCGEFGPYDNPAAYCPLDESVYYSLLLGADIQATVGDFAWITVLAHEWGHHVQTVLGITPELTIDRELQADCFSGAYAQHALQQGYLQEGDVTEAAVMTILSGDPVEMDEFAEGAHGSSDYRLTAFMDGYFNGSGTCLNW